MIPSANSPTQNSMTHAGPAAPVHDPTRSHNDPYLPADRGHRLQPLAAQADLLAQAGASCRPAGRSFYRGGCAPQLGEDVDTDNRAQPFYKLVVAFGAVGASPISARGLGRWAGPTRSALRPPEPRDGVADGQVLPAQARSAAVILIKVLKDIAGKRDRLGGWSRRADDMPARPAPRCHRPAAPWSVR